MARSLPLSAYLTLRRARGPDAGPPGSPRPHGPLLWIHAASPERLATATVLAARLAGLGLRPTCLVTLAAPPGSPSPDLPPDLLVEPAPADVRPAVRAFLDHWRPDLLLWLGGALRPALLAECAERRLPRLLADIWADEVGVDGGSWLPGVTGTLLGGFDQVFAAHEDALHRLRRTGVERLESPGPLDTVAPALTCSERDRADLAAALGTRPVWLAAGLPLQEVEPVVAAYRHAARRSHRLLLIAAPREGLGSEPLIEALRASGLRCASRADGEDPAEDHQVLVADGTAEMGIWYRVAPVAYLGGTLAGTGCRCPFEAATLGSALILGPHTQPRDAASRRLGGRGAAMRIQQASELGPVLEQLIAPDRAAALAAAAWDEATRGAAAADRIAEAIRERMAATA